jgi:putative membrane protein
MSVTKVLRRLFTPRLVENSGSTARDLLAQERTYLAYLRTSLATLTAGFALHELGANSTPSLIVMTAGQALLLGATARHYRVTKALAGGMFIPLRGGVITMTTATAAVGIALGSIFASGTRVLDLPGILDRQTGQTLGEEDEDDVEGGVGC